MPQPQAKNHKVKPNPIVSNIRSFDFPQVQKFLSVIDNIEHKLIMRLGFESACRISEIINIQLKHLDFKDSQIYLEPELCKTRIGGWVEVSEELMNDIKAWLISNKRVKARH